jgi:hypothetical protein
MPKYDKHRPSPVHSPENILKNLPKEVRDAISDTGNDLKIIQRFFDKYGNDPDRIFKKDFVRNIQIRTMYDTLQHFTNAKYGKIIKIISKLYRLSISRVKNILSEFKEYGMKFEEKLDS